jgi:pimeloyl-ACP methyl ester carboxylesterase
MKFLSIITALFSLILFSACVKSEISTMPATTATALPASPTATAAPLTATETLMPTTIKAATPTLTPSPTATSEALTLPAFIPGECRFRVPTGGAECGDLIVPEDRTDPDGRTVSLHVAIFRSTHPNPAPDPVIYLMGGGGGNALGAADYYLHTVGNDIRSSRNFIMYNQRGVHYNDPFLKCPDEEAFYKEMDALEISMEEAEALEEEFLVKCRDYFLAQGIDLGQYDSVTNAADAEDLRRALGYQQVNYYGTSYGTRLALTLMRTYPEGIRSVILDSVFPPQVAYPSEVIASFSGALERVFQRCADDDLCRSQYPDLEATFYQVVDRLGSVPGEITLDGRKVVIDEQVFLDAVYMALHSADGVAGLPHTIDSVDSGSFAALKGAIDSLSGYSRNVATGVNLSSLCRDEIGFDSYENALGVAAGYPPQLADYLVTPYHFELCDLWLSGTDAPVEAVENTPVESDIPALIFAGSYDPITSPEWARRTVETLSSSYLYEFPNLAHGVMRSNDCALNIGLQFLDDPTTEPDASCMLRLSEISFR